MKKFLVVIFSFVHFLVYPVLAQTSKGDYFSSIGLNGSSKSNPNRQWTSKIQGGIINQVTNDKQVNLNSDLKLAYFITNRVAIGLNPQLEYGKQTTYSQNSDAQLTDSSSNVLMVDRVRIFLISTNAMMRVYTIRKNQFGVFVEGGAGPTFALESNKVTTTMALSNPDSNLETITAGKTGKVIPNYKLGIGANYFITDHIGLELSAYYQRYIYKDAERLFANPFKDNYTLLAGVFVGF